MFTFAICCRPSVCRLSVGNARAPYSGGCNFPQHSTVGGRKLLPPPKTTSGWPPTVSGLTSGRPLTSVALCGGLLETTQRLAYAPYGPPTAVSGPALFLRH